MWRARQETVFFRIIYELCVCLGGFLSLSFYVCSVECVCVLLEEALSFLHAALKTLK